MTIDTEDSPDEQFGAAFMSMKYFDKLLEYSASLPTGTYLGKRWKRREPYLDKLTTYYNWFMGEYVKDDDPNQTKIIWRHIYIDEWWTG